MVRSTATYADRAFGQCDVEHEEYNASHLMTGVAPGFLREDGSACVGCGKVVVFADVLATLAPEIQTAYTLLKVAGYVSTLPRGTGETA